MSEDKVILTFEGLKPLQDEARSDQPPGSNGFDWESSAHRRINEAMIAALRANGGTVPGELSSASHIIITVTGRKTGRPRTVVLWGDKVDGRLLVVASLGGAPNHPTWFLNLAANPEVTVEWMGETFQARAVIHDQG